MDCMKHTLPSEQQLQALPADGGPNYNRLVFSKRLYLQQHAHQAIQWYPWGASAFELARITNKPIFLSIGYAACHWCHVMSDTTFDHPDIAALLNQHFVAIKVDKEEHPDIDHVYMTATQLFAQHGGWPNSVFCLPTGQPFFCGTYFSVDDTPRGAGFKSLLTQISDAWANNRQEIDLQAQELERVIQSMSHVARNPKALPKLQEQYQQVIAEYHTQYDPEYGGFGGAPKFPPYAALHLLLDAEDATFHNTVRVTLERMALSGLYDRVEGGFHRYATDVAWQLPHFEKMLTDNAQMLSLYSVGYAKWQEPLFLRVVEETVAYLHNQWQQPSGLYAVSLDADSGGEEGAYYGVTQVDLQTLFSDQLDAIQTFFQVNTEGNVQDEATGALTGWNLLYPVSKDFPDWWDDVRQGLQGLRQKEKIAPSLDTTGSIAANALLAKGLCDAAHYCERPEWAEIAAELLIILCACVKEQQDRLYLDDIVYTLQALVTAEGVGVGVDVTFKDTLWEWLMERWYDHGQGGAWFSQEGHNTPMTRIKDIYDQAVPAPNGVLLHVAVQLNKLDIAGHILGAFFSKVMISVRGCETYWLGVRALWACWQHRGAQVQALECTKIGDGTIALDMVLRLDDGVMIKELDTFVLRGDVGDYYWSGVVVSNIKSRRVAWSNTIERCATGTVQITGMCKLDRLPKVVELLVPVCTDGECYEVTITCMPKKIPRSSDSL